MTLDEKLTLLEGAQEAASTNQFTAGYLPGIPRLGIPSLRLADGPPGVATRQPSTGMTGTMGVAATFSQRDAYENGVVIGRDARALGVDVVLEPFVNIDRDPIWSRAFNTFGEDPLLTGQTGAGEISGIQSQGTMAMVKHFIAYDGGNNVVVDSATLHEIYLQPFADAIDAGVASIMCSYNTVSVVAATPASGGTPGPYSCGNSQTLTGILRGELGFKGFVTSDWGANHATSFINDGYATANVLLGHTDPAGRLPFTWPASLGQGVANQPDTHPERTSNGVDANGKYCTTPGSPFGGPQCTTTYTEGIYVGYRWYDQQHLTPLYPFGYGLSYTRFAYSGLHWAPARDGGLDVAFRVTNTGSTAGDEVPQVYLGAPASGPAGVAFADRALAAYSRITLRPGQSQVVSLHVPLCQLQYWDTQSGPWVTAAGPRPLYVAGNERSAGLTTTVTVHGGGH